MGVHKAILQRIDVSHINDGVKTFYNIDSFKNTDAWKDIPVFYDLKSENPHNNVRHLTFEEVSEGTYPKDEYIIIGNVKSGSLTDGGEPKLMGDIDIFDPVYDAKIKNGEISLSTGFKAFFQPKVDTTQDIIGDTMPYHVLTFKRNGCLNCSPNDKGAMFLNCEPPREEVKMSEIEEPKTEGLLRQIISKLDNLGKAKPAEPVEVLPMEKEPIKSDVAIQFGNVTAERDALKTQIAELMAEKEQGEKDSRWGLLLNVIPAAWKEKEADTRAEFEANPAAFAVKLVTFTNTIPPVQKALGNTACACSNSEDIMKKEIAETEKKTGYKIQ